MKKESRGQVSLEYILIFTISLIILMVFTLPLSEESVSNTLDVSDSLNVKYGMSKVAQAIKEVYGEGQGSKQTISMDSPKNIKVTVGNNYVSCKLKLKSNQYKEIKEYYSSNLKKTSINLEKGENTIIVEWPVGSDNMIIHKQ